MVSHMEFVHRAKQDLIGMDVAALETLAIDAVGSVTDIGADLELAFRSVTLERSSIESVGLTHAIKYLKLSVVFAKKCHAISPNIGKIPFLLIMDLLERQTISAAEVVWRTVEELATELTTPELFNRGKLTVLRFCNALLRRLSKSCNTEFCGRVLMFLAATYPLSERSAVNISGKINVTNIAVETGADNFDSGDGCIAGGLGEEGSESMDVDINSSVDDILALARALQRESSGNNVMVTTSDENDGPKVAIDYNLYKTFWNIQNFVSGESTRLVESSYWADFNRHVEAVLTAFEINSFSDSELTQALVNWESSKAAAGTQNFIPKRSGSSSEDAEVKNNNNNNDAGDAYSGCKYLTSSQLFALQLKDPQIREQITTQLAIHLHYIGLRTQGTIEGEKVLPDIKKMELRCYSILKVILDNVSP